MHVTWLDSAEIARLLKKQHPDLDPRSLRFTELRAFVLALPNFQDNPQRSNERILQAIQKAWMEGDTEED